MNEAPSRTLVQRGVFLLYQQKLLTKEVKMNRKPKLTVNVNMRLLVNDLQAYERQALKLRVPLSTYCRTKLTQDI